MAKYKNILIVDDDPLTLLICEKLMLLAQFTDKVTSYTNGAEAFDQLIHKLEEGNKDSMPQMILLDLNMHGMSGWEFLDKINLIKSDKSQLPPVNIFSSTIAEEDKQKAMRYSFVKNFIRKPLLVEHFSFL